MKRVVIRFIYLQEPVKLFVTCEKIHNGQISNIDVVILSDNDGDQVINGGMAAGPFDAS